MVWLKLEQYKLEAGSNTGSSTNSTTGSTVEMLPGWWFDQNKLDAGSTANQKTMKPVNQKTMKLLV